MFEMLSLVLVGASVLLGLVQGNIIVYSNDTREIANEFRDAQASFGDDLPLEGLRGLLVAGQPADGCSALEKPPVYDNFTYKWIVLLARYNCSFEVKVRNAQAAGYDCAIVHNVNSSDIETMSAKNPDGILIPSVFVSEFAGQVLLSQYLYDSGYYVMVNSDMPFNINTHLLLPFAIVVALCLLVMIVFLVVKCVKDRRRARRHRLPRRALRKIPTHQYRKGDPYDTCAVCLDDYLDGERLRVLPCAHAYHAKCIDPWLTQNRRVCPVCKRRVVAAGEPRDAERDEDDEPLLRDDDDTPSGGTFETQSENPFVRAARFMNRLRRREQEAPAPAPTDSNETEENNEQQDSSDTAPLISTPVVSERTRRSRRTRSADDNSLRTGRPSNPILHSAEHSINRDSPGEIGVAALPAPPADMPPYLNL